MKIKISSTRRVSAYVGSVILVMALSSCLSEAKEKLTQAKRDISDVTTIAESAQQAREDIQKLKEVVPLTNKELKQWLPESLNGWKRTSFGVGKTGYMNVASIEGSFTNEINQASDMGHSKVERQKFSISIVDGAGPTGSVMIAGLRMAGKINMEEETEYKHTQGVTVNGITARQTYHKKRKETALQFVYNKRFGTMVNGFNMSPEETWAMLKKLDLEELADVAK